MKRGEAFIWFLILAFACCAATTVAIAIWAYAWDAFQ